MSIYTAIYQGSINMASLNGKEEELLSILKKMHNGEEAKGEVKPEEPEPELFEEGNNESEREGKMFSDVFGFLPDEMPDFPVTEREVSKEVRRFIPPAKKFESYQPQQEAIYKLVLGMEHRDNVNISGPTGSGKSSMVEYVCSVLQMPFIRMNGRGDIETSSFLGQPIVQDGEIVWRDGMFTLAVKHGAVFCSDEWTVNPPEINMAMQWVMEDGGRLLLSDCPEENKLVDKHPNFRLVCTDNTRGMGDDKGVFAATQVQNTATLDRFGTVIHLDYLDEVHEKAVLSAHFDGLTDALQNRMLQFAALVRRGYEEDTLSLTMSPRTLLNWARKSQFFKDPAKGLHVCFYEKLPSESERSHVKDLFRTVFNKDM